MIKRKLQIIKNKYSTDLIRAAVLLLVICVGIMTMPAELFALDESEQGLDEELAVYLCAQDKASADANASRRSRQRLEPDDDHFAEAMVQDYRPVAGTVKITKDSRFYIVSEDDKISDELLETVQLMDSQFAAYRLPSKKPLEITAGAYEDAKEKDIIIDLQNRQTFINEIERHCAGLYIDEAYELCAGERIELSACTTDGIYYGLMTLMQIAHEKKTGKNKITLDQFRISDAPDVKERTIFIDCARKYFSKNWLENFIRRASFQRYNTIVLHFSEAEGIRLDSDVFPWLTDGLDSLTREEMRDIVSTAKQYHMDVIPSIDTPGHNRYMVSKYAEYVRKHPDFSFEYKGKTYDKKVKGFGSIANHYSRDGVTLKVSDIGIDITKKHAKAFSNALIDDYADFFSELGCTEFDICGDEIMGWSNFMLGDNEVSYDNRWLFLEHWKKYANKNLGIGKGSSSDTFISYINSVCKRLEKKGYTCRVFNDEIDINKNQHVELKKSIGITCWDISTNSAGHFAKKGHTVYNGVMQWCYYVVRKIKGKDIMDGRYKTVNSRNIYENWNPLSFDTKEGKVKKVDPEKFGGAYFFIWCDDPSYKSCEDVWKETELRMWANACKMWNPEIDSKKSGIRAAISYDDFKQNVTGLKSFAGFTGDPEKEAEQVKVPLIRTEEEKTLWEKAVGELDL